MARYIDAEKFLENEIKRCGCVPLVGSCTTDNESLAYQLAKAPTADVVEVKHGEWKLHPDGSGTCSCCNRTQKFVWDYDNAQNFCGHCGAKMSEMPTGSEKVTSYDL